MSQFVVTYISHTPELSEAHVAALNTQLESTSSQCKITQFKFISANAADVYLCSEDPLPLTELQSQLRGLIDRSEDVDIVLQRDDKHRQKKLVVFDMDSTLIYQEVIEMIASYANVEDKVREITDRAMNGELDFAMSLKERVLLLKGLEIEPLYEAIKPRLEITKGVPELCRSLKCHGVKLAVLSGGFIPFANYIKDQLQLDFAKANELEVTNDGRLTGRTKGELVDGNCKARTLLELCRKYSIAPEDSLMVGDGGNDLPAMAVAGFGVAWHAKPRVQELAPSRLNTNSMIDLLHILGFAE